MRAKKRGNKGVKKNIEFAACCKASLYAGVVKIMFPVSGILQSRSDAAMETQEYGPEYGETFW